MRATLTIGEIIKTLDPIHADAFDQLQRALEKKVSEAIGEAEWLKVWNSDNWTINLNLEYKKEA